jgi:hypothetical protein
MTLPPEAVLGPNFALDRRGTEAYDVSHLVSQTLPDIFTHTNFQEWLQIAKGYFTRTHFPGIDALDVFPDEERWVESANR